MPSASVHTLVHIGAGNGCQLSKLTSNAAPVRTVLIEPLPSHADGLRRNHPNTEVWELAISCQHNNQPATLFEFNMSEASSLQQPSGLLQLYPGIKTVRQHQVQTKTPASMMAELNLPEHEFHLLIVEANGEETAIVRELVQQGLLQQFKQVQLALPTSVLYSRESNVEQLQASHFELVQEITEDPDIHMQCWQFNEFSYQLEQQHKALSAQIQAQEKEITQLTAQLQQEQTKHIASSRHADALKSQLAELKTQHAESSQQLSGLQQSLNEAKALQLQKQKEIAALKASVENSQQAQQSAQNKLTALEQALAEKQALLASSEEKLTKYKSYFQSRKKQHEAAEQKISDLTQQLSHANAQINQLQEQLQKQQQAGSKLSELEQKMEQLFASQAEQLRQNTNALGQHVTKMHASSNRQWQVALAVQHSLSFGEQPLQFSDTSISPELAQHLITLVQNNNYDLIIEFGSGHSTSLLARTLLGKHQRSQSSGRLALQEHNAGTPQTHLAPSEHDLPKRIISFEHNKTYYQQTFQSIKQQGLGEVVELVHAPLVNCTFSPEHLFYDCEANLKQLADLLQNEEKHILVLVDGPSAEPTEHSRTPALPALLNHFARHRLDVVLDDHHRDSEQHSAEQWRSQLAERSLSFKEHTWAGDKSALLLSINS
ncbi:hypothetical protein [Oceanimonas baumannii]|uniref:FkbM family methyltransferase n=1 Tax=Oceanimonas baumannii TaxID=129578 RepID=A0A235C976_9GAMM|nr:hypothetical protein [Oceanimonas baumannii]OYD21133.1 hypothetical protein B6S09_17460 [Oceanimonas baumannii]TDW56964.1 FkbM family methyltransferase [Oceanimonas baumannii]